MSPELLEAMNWLATYLLGQDLPKSRVSGVALSACDEPGWWEFHVYYDGESAFSYGLELETDDYNQALVALIDGVDKRKETG